MMSKENDNAGVFIPPPLLFIGMFFLAVLIQRFCPVNSAFFHTAASVIISAVFILLGLIFGSSALFRFFTTKNTVITYKPAHSLQTTGIYTISRNPMYMGLVFLYLGIAFYGGNWWHLILLPALFFIVQEYIIKREERYLHRRFGQVYLDYRVKVRRWI